MYDTVFGRLATMHFSGFALLTLAAICCAAPASAETAGVLQPQNFGAKCDGVADDTEPFKAFVSALASAAGPATGHISGQCKLTAPVAVRLKAGASLEGVGANPTILCAGPAAGWCLMLSGGATGAKVPVVTDASKGAKQISVGDASKLEAGDYIFITYSSAQKAGLFAQGQLNKIGSRTGNTLSLVYPLTFPIALRADHIATVEQRTMSAGFTLKNLIIDGGGTPSQHGLYVTHFVGAAISGLEVRRFQGRTVQTGLLIANCDRCVVQNLRATRMNGQAIYFYGMLNSRMSDIRASDLTGVPIEYTWSASSTVSDVLVELDPASNARAFKTTGATENTFRNINLSGGRFRTGFSLTSGSSYNKVYNLVSRKSASCVWLNGTANNYNHFDGVVTDECAIRREGTAAVSKGNSIAVSATAPYVDVGNTFVNVQNRARDTILIRDPSNRIGP